VSQTPNKSTAEIEAAGAAERAKNGKLPKLAEMSLQTEDGRYNYLTAPKRAIDNFEGVEAGSTASVHVDFQRGILVYDFGGGLE